MAKNGEDWVFGVTENVAKNFKSKNQILDTCQVQANRSGSEGCEGQSGQNWGWRERQEVHGEPFIPYERFKIYSVQSHELWQDLIFFFSRSF